MTTPDPSTDLQNGQPHDLVPTSSLTSSRDGYPQGPGHERNDLVPGPPIFDGDEVGEPSAGRPDHLVPTPGTTSTDWTPEHPSTRAAWTAVLANLTERANRGRWSSRTIAITIAQREGDLDYKRAADLIRSAIKHGYLEERPYPGEPRGHNREQTQIWPTTIERRS
jgi:hypothetical protein